MLNKRIAVSSSNTETDQKAQLLAESLKLPFIADVTQEAQFDYILILTPSFLGLRNTKDKPSSIPFHINFTTGKLGYRIARAGLRNELLAKAIGFKPKDKPYLIDATAGLGRDGYLLASLGFEVTMIERSPIVYSLLSNALMRAYEASPIPSSIKLINQNAIQFLETLKQKPQVIYLDPMFPIREKSASIKKEMAILQELLGKDEDAETLFQVALSCATHRVVVKRPRLAANIGNLKPDFSLTGNSSRFDIYLTHTLKKG